ncbi:MAG: ATP-dependent Clp protease proteolytic subunit [Rhodobacteraceae bacterium]|nr:ATP-dependent Clp protease proteolytic subunit [Paracoccaceae bacterium]
MSDQAQDHKSAGNEIEQRLFKSRNVIITGGIDDKLANRTARHLLALAEEGDDPINLFISSPGGHVESGDMVHDMIKFIKPKVRTIGSGWVASAGALIFVGAEKEDRYCLPNTRFLLHQPSGGIGGQATDMAIQAEQIRQMRERFHQLFAEATGQTAETIARDTQRDFWLTTQEALDYGLLGQVISSAEQLA